MVIKRSYQTIFDTLGNIGGTSGIVSILIMLVFSPLYEYLEGKYLLQIAFPLLAHPPTDDGQPEGDKAGKRLTDEVSAVDRPMWKRLLLCRSKKYTKV